MWPMAIAIIGSIVLFGGIIALLYLRRGSSASFLRTFLLCEKDELDIAEDKSPNDAEAADHVLKEDHGSTKAVSMVPLKMVDRQDNAAPNHVSRIPTPSSSPRQAAVPVGVLPHSSFAEPTWNHGSVRPLKPPPFQTQRASSDQDGVHPTLTKGMPMRKRQQLPLDDEWAAKKHPRVQPVRGVPESGGTFPSRTVLTNIVQAQNGELSYYPNYELALEEIQYGRKQSCWMWYIWPSMHGIRSHRMPQLLLPNFQAAIDYLQHKVLRHRLVEITKAAERTLLLGQSTTRLFGGQLDSTKVHESCTVFALAALVIGHEEEFHLFVRLVKLHYGGPNETVMRFFQEQPHHELLPPRRLQMVASYKA